MMRSTIETMLCAASNGGRPQPFLFCKSPAIEVSPVLKARPCKDLISAHDTAWPTTSSRQPWLATTTRSLFSARYCQTWLSPENNGYRGIGGRRGRSNCKRPDHDADIRAGSRRLARRLVLEPGRGQAPRGRTPGVHADADRPRR